MKGSQGQPGDVTNSLPTAPRVDARRAGSVVLAPFSTRLPPDLLDRPGSPRPSSASARARSRPPPSTFSNEEGLTIEDRQQPVRASDFYTETVLPTPSSASITPSPSSVGAATRAAGSRLTSSTRTRGSACARSASSHTDRAARLPRPRRRGDALDRLRERGHCPRGADFVRAVRELAERAGVDPSPLERSQPRDRRATSCAISLGSAASSSSAKAAPRRAHTSRAAASLKTRSRTRVSGWSRRRRRRAVCSSGPATVPRRSPRRASSPTPAGRADSVAPGGTATAGSAPSGRGRLRKRQPPIAVTSTSAAPVARTCRPTVSPTSLTDRQTRREIVLVEGFFDVHQLRVRDPEHRRSRRDVRAAADVRAASPPRHRSRHAVPR